EVAALLAGSESPVDRAVGAFLQQDFHQSLAWCDGVLKTEPEHGPAQLHRARALHNLGRIDQALAAFRELVKAHPDFPEAWAALAHALRFSGREEAACQAYERALALSPGLHQARMNLGVTWLNLDRAEQAQVCFEQLLDRNSDDVEAMVYLGLALRLSGQNAMARRRLTRALRLAPGHPDAHRYLAGLYNQAGEVNEALSHLRQAMAARPDDPDLMAELADIHELSSDMAEAQAAVDRGLALAPEHPQLNLMAARLARRDGNLTQAEQRLRSIPPVALPPRLALQRAQEMGLVLDRLEQADEAFEAFVEANRLAARDGRMNSVDRNAFGSALRTIDQGLNGQTVDLETEEDSGADLIFLIGFTRSGTTLLDTFFKARQDVITVEEKPTIERVIDEAGLEALGCDAVAALSPVERAALRKRYRQYLAAYIPRDWKGWVIDRMPLRLIHVALLHQLFPRARFLLAERHPCDVILSNFMQIFEPGDALVHCDTLDSTVYLYDQVMRVWQRIRPMVADRLVSIRYEALVNDPEGELRRLCDELGWPFDPTMLDREQRISAAGRVRTASYQQVHEPIYGRAAGRWQRYAAHFEAHRDVLNPHLDALGYGSF
ncbi:MAG: sulfotransferase, partial [Pseudomonadota bacterium]